MSVLELTLQCASDFPRPLSNYWTLSYQPQHCLSETNILLSGGILNTMTDLLLVILPIPIVWGLKLPTRQQVIVVMLFGAGFLVTIAGIVRSIYTYKLTTTFDKTWNGYPVWLASSVELYVGIVCRLRTPYPACANISRYVPLSLQQRSSSVATSLDFLAQRPTNPKG